MTDSIIQHLLENKKHTANHRNSKKTTTFVFNKCSVTYLRKCPIIQHLVSDSGHSQKRLKESGTTHICKAMKYTDLHLSPHSVYLSKQRLYRLKWTVTDNQWCKYAASKSCFWASLTCFEGCITLFSQWIRTARKYCILNEVHLFPIQLQRYKILGCFRR